MISKQTRKVIDRVLSLCQDSPFWVKTRRMREIENYLKVLLEKEEYRLAKLKGKDGGDGNV